MQLSPVNLRKGKGHDHPDIDARSLYLAEIKFDEDRASTFLVGRFSRQWYGLNFDCNWGASGLQFDTPGSNCSCWKRLWRIENARSESDAMSKLMRAGIQKFVKE